jgi:hypothetical protein
MLSNCLHLQVVPVRGPGKAAAAAAAPANGVAGGSSSDEHESEDESEEGESEDESEEGEDADMMGEPHFSSGGGAVGVGGDGLNGGGAYWGFCIMAGSWKQVSGDIKCL